MYKSLPSNSGQEFILSNLISESKETKVAWDALDLIAQDLLREGKPLPPALAEWVADVLADQLVKKKEQRWPRPDKGAHRVAHRNGRLCILISELRYLFDFNATRRYDDPPESACDVVAAAMDMPYKTVEKIWNGRSPEHDSFQTELDKQTYIQRRYDLLSSLNL